MPTGEVFVNLYSGKNNRGMGMVLIQKLSFYHAYKGFFPIRLFSQNRQFPVVYGWSFNLQRDL